MKRGNLLLVFAFSLFLVIVFSFLPMVSATHCMATSEDDCYNNPDGHSDGTYRPKEFSICGGQDNKFITYHYCQWNDVSSVCKPEYLEIFDCGTLLNHKYCDSRDPYDGHTLEDSSGNIVEGIFKYTGYCKPIAYGSGFDVNAGCEIKPESTCKSDERCTRADEDFLSLPNFECVKYPAAEETITSEEETELTQLLGYKSLIFKIALAILLIALILLILIYFKPKKKKRK